MLPLLCLAHFFLYLLSTSIFYFALERGEYNGGMGNMYFSIKNLSSNAMVSACYLESCVCVFFFFNWDSPIRTFLLLYLFFYMAGCHILQYSWSPYWQWVLSILVCPFYYILGYYYSFC